MVKKQRISNRSHAKTPESIEYRVQIGKTDGFRYVGVQPPFEAQADCENFATILDDELGDYSHVLSGYIEKPDHGDAYTQFTVMGSPDDEHLLAGVGNAMDACLYSGQSAQVDEKIRGIGYGYYLFGGRANTLG